MSNKINGEVGATPQGAIAPLHTPREVEEIVVLERLALYNRGKSCGPRALRKHLSQKLDPGSLPSQRTIARILMRRNLTNGRTGFYPGDIDESNTDQVQCKAQGTNPGSEIG
jgi:hypothetical protein